MLYVFGRHRNFLGEALGVFLHCFAAHVKKQRNETCDEATSVLNCPTFPKLAGTAMPGKSNLYIHTFSEDSKSNLLVFGSLLNNAHCARTVSFADFAATATLTCPVDQRE